jgi:hypothetical protein
VAVGYRTPTRGPKAGFRTASKGPSDRPIMIRMRHSGVSERLRPSSIRVTADAYSTRSAGGTMRLGAGGEAFQGAEFAEKQSGVQ